ncbi:MAG: tetratricopeptide repeat protein [Spirochaetaceae bacterium]|jgi:tetratricopeptide (TPR) repeat protein|nr:tetratricopeptide repeat protein [Spirochaetaceae bacterium]
MKHAMNVYGMSCLAALGAALFLSSCASAPERPLEITALRSAAEDQIESANRAADRGDYEGALNLLDEARKLAVSTDRPDLRIRESLSRGSVFFYLGRIDEADAVWNSTLAEAADDRVLAPVCRIYMARSRIFRLPENSRERRDEAAGVLALVRREMDAVKNHRLYTALAWTVIGLAEKECGRYAEAEKALKNSLEIHEKERYLEQAAYDWYLIASVRSMSGQYDGAQAALREALGYDRRAENSHGLGMDWIAIGDIHAKTGGTFLAAAAYRRASEIFRSIDLEENALMAEARLRDLTT